MICASCYRDLPPDAAYCPRCGARRRAAAGPPEDGASAERSAAAPVPGDNPWEQRGGRGRIAAFAETLQESLFRPTAFFRRTAPEGGAGAALWYAVLVGTLSLAVALLWQQALFYLHGLKKAEQPGHSNWQYNDHHKEIIQVPKGELDHA